MHKDFVEAVKGLAGKVLDRVSLDESGSYMLFELHIGGEVLCFEVDRRSGRCFLMSEGSVDGAGVFPLRCKHEWEYKTAGTLECHRCGALKNSPEASAEVC